MTELDLASWIGRRVHVVVDRPLGSAHPDDPSMVYELNYGFVPGTRSPDGEPVDVYIIDADAPLKECEGEVIAIIRRRDDNEDKLVARVGTGSWSRDQIESRARFQERWFDSVVENGADVERRAELVEVDSALLWTSAQGAGPPMALCHGGPGLWDNLGSVARVVDDRVTVHRYDQRGGGRSSNAPPYDVSRFVADLEALRRHWGHDSWIVGGHSWGASLALAYAATYPDRVTGLLYVSGTGLAWDWHSAYKREVSNRLGEQRQSQLVALKEKRTALETGASEYAVVDRDICRLQWSTDLADPARAPELLETLIDERFVPNYEVNRQVTEDWKRLGSSQSFSAAVARVACPVLMVHGAGDPRPAAALEDLTGRLANCSVALIDGAGHFPWLEAPDRFKSAIRPFLDRLVRS